MTGGVARNPASFVTLSSLHVRSPGEWWPVMGSSRTRNAERHAAPRCRAGHGHLESDPDAPRGWEPLEDPAVHIARVPDNPRARQMSGAIERDIITPSIFLYEALPKWFFHKEY